METILNSNKNLLSLLIIVIGIATFQKCLFCSAFISAKQSCIIRNIKMLDRCTKSSKPTFSSTTSSSSLSFPFYSHSSTVTMKWMFGKGSGNMQEVGGIGPQGEYYFVPSKQPSLKAPPHALGKIINLAIFPRNQVLGPLGEEYLGLSYLVISCHLIIVALFMASCLILLLS